MKILHVLTTLDVGGAEMHVLKQVRGQAARGHEVRVVYLKGQGTLCEGLPGGGRVRGGHVAGGPLFPFGLRRDLSWCDLAHSHLLKADAMTAAAARSERRAPAHQRQAQRRAGPPAGPREPGPRVVGRVPARTIVLSEHVGRFIEEHGRVPAEPPVAHLLRPRPRALRGGRALESIAPPPRGVRVRPEDVVFICVARFAPQKAHEILLRAPPSARAIDPRVKLLLVGDDPFGDGRQRAEAEARPG